MKTQKISVEYLDHLGTDLTVVNAARASFGKESDWETNPDGTYAGPKNRLKPADAGLIRFLATGYRTGEWETFLDEIIRAASLCEFIPGEGDPRGTLTDILHAYKRKAQHWAPFAHPQLQIRIRIPIFLARQFVKHQVGAVWSEESRRYISDEPGVWFPEEWHTRPEDIKQGSEGPITHMTWNDGGDVEREEIDPIVRELTAQQLHAYMQMVEGGVAPEEARIVLPLNTMTTVVWTGSLLFWSRVCNQRLDGHAQRAAQELAKQIAAIAQPLFPVSWAALVGE